MGSSFPIFTPPEQSTEERCEMELEFQVCQVVRVFYHEPGINSLPRNFYTSLFVMVPTMIPQMIEIQFL